jgi:hypothetical protein
VICAGDKVKPVSACKTRMLKRRLFALESSHDTFTMSELGEQAIFDPAADGA